jgi:hypothetical protein
MHLAVMRPRLTSWSARREYREASLLSICMSSESQKAAWAKSAESLQNGNSLISISTQQNAVCVVSSSSLGFCHAHFFLVQLVFTDRPVRTWPDAKVQ